MNSGAIRIQDERERQVNVKGYSAEYDDKLVHGELARAALAYLMWYITISLKWIQGPWSHFPELWPFELALWHPDNDAIDGLVKVGAFVAAEIDRLQRQLDRENEQEISMATGWENPR